MEKIDLFPIFKRLQVHIPFHFLFRRYLPIVCRYGINPEISFSSDTLDTYQYKDYCHVAARLREAGVRTTIHAPFMDLRPGAIDSRIRRVSEDRLVQVLAIAHLFRPASIVCHPSFDDRYYVSTEDQWLENSLQTWRSLLAKAGENSILLTLENVYEKGPRQLQRLLEALASPACGFCFDTGHFNVFAQESLTTWLEAMHPFLRQVHLHDNHGQADEHLPVGEGTFPFEDFFAIIKDKGIVPIFTIEAHSENNLLRSLENMGKLAFFAEGFPC